MSFHKDDQPMPGSTGVHMHARVSPDQQRSTSATGEQMDNLLLPIDDSIYSYYAFQSAKNCIQKANGRARLFFLHVDRPFGTVMEKLTPQKKIDQYEEEGLINASRLFAFYGQLCRENGIDFTLIRALDAHPSNKINEAVNMYNITHIILGQGGAATSGLTGVMKRKVVGSTTKAVLENAPVDVTIVKRVYEDVNEERFKKLLSERSPQEVSARDQLTEEHPFQIFQFIAAGQQGIGATQWSGQGTTGQILESGVTGRGLGTSQYGAGQGLGTSQYQQGVGTQQIPSQQGQYTGQQDRKSVV